MERGAAELTQSSLWSCHPDRPPRSTARRRWSWPGAGYGARYARARRTVRQSTAHGTPEHGARYARARRTVRQSTTEQAVRYITIGAQLCKTPGGHNAACSVTPCHAVERRSALPGVPPGPRPESRPPTARREHDRPGSRRILPCSVQAERSLR